MENTPKNEIMNSAVEVERKDLENYNFEVEDISNKIPPEIKTILEKEKISPEEEKILGVFINEITDGKYFDHSYANHVFDAHYKINTSNDSKVFENIETNKFRQASGSDFWLAFGESRWVDENIKNKEMVLFSANNPKFAEFLFGRAANYFWDMLPMELQNKLNESYKINSNKTEEIKETLSIVNQNIKFTEDLKKLERIDENGKIYYEVSFHDDTSKNLLPILMLEKKIIKIKDNDTTGGMVFNGGPDGLDFLAKQLNVPKLKWVDIADTIVNLKKAKVYRYKSLD